MDQITREYRNLKMYIWNNRWHILISFILLVIVYGTWLFNMNPRIDAEVLINTPRTTYNYLDSGRQGNVLTEILFGMRWFNPFFVTCSGFFMFGVAGVLLGFLCWRVGAEQKISAWFGLICFTCPIMTEMIYFDMLIFKAAWAYILCMLAVSLTLCAARCRSWLQIVLAVFCMMWAVSTYEIFAVIYVTLVVFCFIMLYQKWDNNINIKNSWIYISLVLKSILVIVVAVVLNTIISNMFFSSGIGYVYGKFQWNQRPVKDCLKTVLMNIEQGLLGDGIFYTAFMGITTGLVLIMMCINIVSNKKQPYKFLYLIAGLGLQLCPFLLTIFLGGVPEYRAQLSYPIVLAFNLIFLMSQPYKKKMIRIIIMLIMIMTIWTQSQVTMRLEYTDLVRTQEDIRVATQIEYRISEVSNANKPIAFVGIYNNKLNNACLRGQLIGLSVFSHDAQTLPRYLNSSNRACHVLQTWGFDFRPIEYPEQMIQARIIANDMPAWPNKKSVYDAGDYIIVKLSEDSYYADDIMVSGIEYLGDKLNESISDDVIISVDSISKKNRILQVNGWVIDEDYDMQAVKKHILLYDDNNNFYKMTTCNVERLDVVEAYGNSYYQMSGFLAKAPVEQLPNNYKKMKVAIMLEYEDGNVVYLKTDKTIK